MSKLNQLAINEEGFVFDPTSGESFTVNRTGLVVLKGLREDKTREQIAALLVESFEVSQDEAEADAADFIARLQTYKMI